jgi:hypothetical protein
MLAEWIAEYISARVAPSPSVARSSVYDRIVVHLLVSSRRVIGGSPPIAALPNRRQTRLRGEPNIRRASFPTSASAELCEPAFAASDY